MGAFGATSHQINDWNVSHKLQKRSLLIAVNCIAGLSIFFFGYDQGVMGGVNQAKGKNTSPQNLNYKPALTNRE